MSVSVVDVREFEWVKLPPYQLGYPRVNRGTYLP